MKNTVDNYRGWEIFFDTDSEKFSAYSNVNDMEISGKVSYASCKKYIDDFMKDKQNFKPFQIVKRFSKEAVLKVIGVRKDGRLITENSKGEKEQLSSYSEGDYVLYTPVYDDMKAKRDELYKILQDARIQLENYEKQCEAKLTTVRQYKKSLQP